MAPELIELFKKLIKRMVKITLTNIFESAKYLTNIIYEAPTIFP